MVILILIAFIVACITMDAIVQISRQRKSKSLALHTYSDSIFNESSLSIPKGLFFDKTHTWAFMEKNGTVKIGIDDFLLHITGPLNRVKTKNQGEKILKGEPALSIIQNGKQLTINSPISGFIKIVNPQLRDNPTSINSSPYQEGWVYLIEPINWIRDSKFLFMSERYSEWLKNEFTRFRDFIAITVTANNSGYAPIILQDGGELKDNILEELGPEIWEEFQNKFINTSR